MAVYLPVLGFDFVRYDDYDYVLDNDAVRGGLTAEGLRWAAGSLKTGNWIPLTWLSHMAAAEAFGERPGGHHLVNVLLHAAGAALLFLTLCRLTGAAWPSGLAAGLFALHPLRVESVAWVSGRKDVLSGFLFLAALLAYAAYAGRPGRTRLALPLALFVLGLMAKPTLVTLPLLLLVLDWWPLGRMKGARGPKGALKLVAEKTPFLAVSVAASCLAYLAQSRTLALRMEGGGAPSLAARASNASWSYALYLWKTVWPGRLAVLYPFPDRDPALALKGAAAAALLAAISVLALKLARRAPYLSAGWFWYLAALLPVAGIVQVGSQGMADRYTYLLSIGLAVAVAWVWWRRSAGHRRLAALAAAGVLVILSAATSLQLRHWKDSFTLFGHALEVTEGNHIMHKSLGLALALEGRLDEAVAHYREALRLRPQYPEARNCLGWALAEKGRHAEAAAEFWRAVSLDPAFAGAWNNLGRSLTALGKVDEANAAYREAIRLEPDFAEALNNLGANLTGQGRLAEGLSLLQRAFRAAPDRAQVSFNLGVNLNLQGKHAEALEALARAMRLDPSVPEISFQIGLNLVKQGREEAARAYLEQALALRPGYLEAMRLLEEVRKSEAH